MTESWNRRAWHIAWPTILSNVSVPLLGAVDLAVVGHLPDPKYLGAVAVGVLIFTVIYHGFIFLRMGTTGLTAQALGLAKPDEVRAWLVRGGKGTFHKRNELYRKTKSSHSGHHISRRGTFKMTRHAYGFV